MVEAEREVRCLGLGRQAQRIEVGGQVATQAVAHDQLADGTFARIAGAGTDGSGIQQTAGGAAAGIGHLLHDDRVRHVTGFATLEAVEIRFPFRPDTVGGDQVLLVQVLEIGGVGAELRGLGKLLQETVHNGAEALRWGQATARP